MKKAEFKEFLEKTFAYDRERGVLYYKHDKDKVGLGSICSDGFKRLKVLKKKYKTINLIALMLHPSLFLSRAVIYHRNGNKLDETISNIGVITREQRKEFNKKIKEGKVRGTVLLPDKKRYRVFVTWNGVTLFNKETDFKNLRYVRFERTKLLEKLHKQEEI